MTSAPSTSRYFLLTPDTIDLPNSKVLNAGSNFEFIDDGSTLKLSPFQNLLSLSQIGTFSTNGYVVYNSGAFSVQPLAAGTGITLSNPTGFGTANSLSVNSNNTTQLINVLANSLPLSQRAAINFIAQGLSSINVTDNAGSKRTDITINGPSSLTPSDATYILQTPNSLLPNAQALSQLATGILKSHTTTGVVSIATPNVDYQLPSPNLLTISGFGAHLGNLIVGGGAGGLTELTSGDVNFLLHSDGTSLFWGDVGDGTVTSIGITSSSNTISVAGPGPNPITSSGTINIDLPSTGVIPGVGTTFANIVVDAYGRITTLSQGNIFGTVTSAGIITTDLIAGGTNPVTTSGFITLDMNNSGVEPKSYTNPNLTISIKGVVTDAESTTFTWLAYNNGNLPGNSILPIPGYGYVLQSSPVGDITFYTQLINSYNFEPGERFILVNEQTSGVAVKVQSTFIYGAVTGGPGGQNLTLPAGTASSVELLCISNSGAPSFLKQFQIINFTGAPVITP